MKILGDDLKIPSAVDLQPRAKKFVNRVTIIYSISLIVTKEIFFVIYSVKIEIKLVWISLRLSYSIRLKNISAEMTL